MGGTTCRRESKALLRPSILRLSLAFAACLLILPLCFRFNTSSEYLKEINDIKFKILFNLFFHFFGILKYYTDYINFSYFYVW